MSANYLKYLEELKDHFSVQTLDEHVLRIERTAKTPFIQLDAKEGIVVIFGISIPENSIAFYKPVVSFLRDNFERTERIRAYEKVDYCNSSTGKCLLDIMKILEGFFKTGKDVEVFCYQEDEDPGEYCDARDYQVLLRNPIHVFELDDEKLDEVDDFFAQL